MKLLFDEDLSPRLSRALVDASSKHVHDCGLGSADDSSIWEYAKDHGFTIISKDSDFQDRSALQGQPPKVIWLRVANCSSSEIENLLRTAVELVRKFVEEEESYLVLGPRRRPVSSGRTGGGH